MNMGTKQTAGQRSPPGVRLTAGAKAPFIYVLKQELRVKGIGRTSRFKIEAHKILMRHEEYEIVKAYRNGLEDRNKRLKVPLKYEIWKESMAFGDGKYV